jgi:lipopolysaccharide export system ATP-binding protein
VIVCDEPFSGIDPLGARKVAALLRAEAGRGLAIVLADHHASLALGICDRAILLVDGEIRREGSAQEMREDPVVRERYLGRAEVDLGGGRKDQSGGAPKKRPAP